MPDLFLIKLQACNFIEKETLAQVFSYEFCAIFKNKFHRTPLVVASAFQQVALYCSNLCVLLYYTPKERWICLTQ